MNVPAALPTVSVTVKTVDVDTVFAALGDPSRRRILQGLSDGKPRIATIIRGFIGKRLSATIKHLAALKNSGLIISQKDPEDSRRQIYTLAPSILVAVAEDGRRTLDFGYCLLRF